MSQKRGGENTAAALVNDVAPVQQLTTTQLPSVVRQGQRDIQGKPCVCMATSPQTLQEECSVRGETRTKISGLLKQAKKARTVFGLLCAKALFGPCEAVAKVLQGEKSTAAGALECVKALKRRVHALRNEKAMEEILNKTSAAAHDLKMPDPAGSRHNRG
ncbi:hypothetical protein F7725_021467 [Dissostichus mawsoni]|uniref:Uncharacterized protein n=1 Tax=Dissostichus mawsoni TaxID=36200 RepID=A0A7J5ZFC6_DISMA|nr:hypothetical protein F7725_021467 [Dissostichus mawsoni]